MSYKWIAEIRVQNKHKNLEVLNSYLVGKDGVHYFYEVICVDPSKHRIVPIQVPELVQAFGTPGNRPGDVF